MIKLKTKEQIDGIRKSCKLLAELYLYIEEHIKIGISTLELDSIAYNFIIKNKAIPAFKGYNGFPSTLCTSLNEEVIHGIPKKSNILKDGDILSIDCGIILDNYYSDCAKSFGIGTMSDNQKRLLETTEKALYAGINKAIVGNKIKDISIAIEKEANKSNLGIVRDYCGHGVGISLHEEPSVPNYHNGGYSFKLQPGLIIAIEPMFNLGSDEVFVLKDNWTVSTKDKQMSAHFEHTIVILPEGPEILTKI